MTAVSPRPPEVVATRPYPERRKAKGSFIYTMLTTTDHKLIGMMYIVACFGFFLIGGLMALLMRGELAQRQLPRWRPGPQRPPAAVA